MVVADVNEAAAAAVAGDIGGIAVATDVTSESDVVALVRRSVELYGRVDIFCSNAGIAVGGGAEAPDMDWQRSWEVHVMAHVYAARAVLPAMVEGATGTSWARPRLRPCSTT